MAEWIAFDDATLISLKRRERVLVKRGEGDPVQAALGAAGAAAAVLPANDGSAQLILIRRREEQMAGGFLGLTDEVPEEENTQRWWHRFWRPLE